MHIRRTHWATDGELPSLVSISKMSNFIVIVVTSPRRGLRFYVLSDSGSYSCLGASGLPTKLPVSCQSLVVMTGYTLLLMIEDYKQVRLFHYLVTMDS